MFSFIVLLIAFLQVTGWYLPYYVLINKPPMLNFNYKHTLGINIKTYYGYLSYEENYLSKFAKNVF